MSIIQTNESTAQKPLRVWPGVVAAVLLLLLRFVVPRVLPEANIFGVLGSFAGVAAIVLWWLFFSRAPWIERIGVVLLLILAVVATPRILYSRIAAPAASG